MSRRLQPLFVVVFALLLVAFSTLEPAESVAQGVQITQRNFPDDRFSIFAPSAWKVARLHQDGVASIYGFQFDQRVEVVLYVLHLDKPPYKGERFAGKDFFTNMSEIAQTHGALRVDPKELPEYALPRCGELIATRHLEKKKRLIELVGCSHPDNSRFYIWRFETSMKEISLANRNLKDFTVLISASMVLLDEKMTPLNPPRGFQPLPGAVPPAPGGDAPAPEGGVTAPEGGVTAPEGDAPAPEGGAAPEKGAEPSGEKAPEREAPVAPPESP